ncbi:MAG: hypothetical protein JJE30_08890 [Desulfuromonadales bacterium]|nr:hypothetical protein [Desulfuromonadales bacterium]
MKVKVLEEITLSKTTLHPGEIINIPDSLLPKLGAKVEPLPIADVDDGRGLPHYCADQDAWCSTKLPGSTTFCRNCEATQ